MNVYQEARALDLTLAALAKPPKAVTCRSCSGKVYKISTCLNCGGERCGFCGPFHMSAECIADDKEAGR